MSCFTPDRHNRASKPTKKGWKSLMSALQKKIYHFKRYKALTGGTIFSQYFEISHDCVRNKQSQTKSNFHAKPLMIEAASNSTTREECQKNKEEVVEVLEEEQKAAVETDEEEKKSKRTMELHGVDASAQDFIDKMKEYWQLEKQKSIGKYIELCTRYYEYPN